MELIRHNGRERLRDGWLSRGDGGGERKRERGSLVFIFYTGLLKKLLPVQDLKCNGELARGRPESAGDSFLDNDHGNKTPDLLRGSLCTHGYDTISRWQWKTTLSIDDLLHHCGPVPLLHIPLNTAISMTPETQKWRFVLPILYCPPEIIIKPTHNFENTIYVPQVVESDPADLAINH